MKPLHVLLLSVALALPGLTHAQSSSTFKENAAADARAKAEKGWWYFEKKKEPPKLEEPAPQPQPEPVAQPSKPEKSKEEKCKEKATWSADCGFVHPGQDFEFQAKQRDALMERMVVSNNDPQAVEAFQYYMRWVLERTSEVTNLWWYNMVQNPELDPTAAQPISAMGLRLMTEVRKGSEAEIFDVARDEGGMFVFFSRSDCIFCHQMAEPLRIMQERTKLPIRNASLDGQCIAPFVEGCLTGEVAIQAAQALQVATVPTVFLYIKPNTWIRIATGITDADSMATRAMQFFTAYRTALLKGVENGQDGRPSVDFGKDEGPTGNLSTGVGAGKRQEVSEELIHDLLGRKN
ncbi:hypothetical protein WDL1P1_00023 (plasmid) [Variovorax sp. WDL1]|uniref:conjugal transfer protein TraF n=1 Tax=Variovorax sp. WDL1 TaxID=207745 RepID=UPI000B20F8A4|nr:conjugal transfer protein TraF [Variovorax sp. WDL1]PNG50029.1 hypothetical protein CHC06_05610 [Variovorax sp. B2]PNG50901.1 hypothetical protein CHC07_05515 [Variovorax sp. B4]VTV17053.1 hypothetical protein WDL1P1_00023 [Variovorax sp. WDL1]